MLNITWDKYFIIPAETDSHYFYVWKLFLCEVTCGMGLNFLFPSKLFAKHNLDGFVFFTEYMLNEIKITKPG